MSKKPSTVVAKTDSKPETKKEKQPKESSLTGDVGKKYKLMVQILTSDPRYAKALAEVTQPSVHDKLSSSLVNISYEIGASLSIVKSLILLEFERKFNHPTTILRVNSIVTKMMGKYTKKVGDDYLRNTLGDLVKEVVNDKDLSLEVNPNKLVGDDIEKQGEENLEKLFLYCEKFFDKIIDEDIVAAMPRELRAICYFIELAGEQFKLDKDQFVYPLISGFVMLRYLCPAIMMPNNSGIIPSLPTGNARANFVYIAKCLQKLGNNEKFEVSEAHLMPMNRFIEKYRGKLMKYLKSLPFDLEKQEGKLPFGDLMKKITYQDIHLKIFSVEDLHLLHGLIFDFGFELISSLQTEVILTEDKRPISIVSMETDFLTLVHELGPPPGRETNIPEKELGAKNQSGVFGKKGDKNAPKEGEKQQGEVKARDTMAGKTVDEIDSSIISKTLDVLMANIKSFNLTNLEQSRFFYLGKPSKQNVPVFYLVLHRLDKTFLESTDKLTVFLYKTIWKHVDEPYILIIDMSWAKLTDEIQASLYRAVVAFIRLMKKDHLRNCQNVYLLHPTIKNLEAIEEILNLMDDQTRAKVMKDSYEWTDISDLIEPTKVWIPFVSKKFVPITYNLVKITSKDKKQERLLKIGHDSLLNIDPKNGTVHNEISLNQIQEIRSRKEANEIIIKFTAHSDEDSLIVTKSKQSSMSTDQSTPQTLRYSCFTENQRDIIVESIFDSSIRSCSLEYEQTFNILKENESGKKEPRILKLTSDSILNFQEKIIKKEIPYATIQSFYVDHDEKDKLTIHFMNKGQKRAYIVRSKEAERLRDALLDAIMRFRFYVTTEQELFKRTKVDAVMSKFYAAATSSESNDYDSKQWKAIFRVDTPTKDLKKLFEKFKADKYGRVNLDVESVRPVVDSLKLDFSDKNIEHLIEVLDPKKRGFCHFDDIVSQWIFLKKEKAMIDKKKQHVLAAKKNKPTK